MRAKRSVAALLGVSLLVLASAPRLHADPKGNHGHGNGNPGSGGNEGTGNGAISHVLLLSIDGMHALDFTNCAK